MVHVTVRAVQILSILGCVSSFFYYLLCLWSARAFLRANDPGVAAISPQNLPTVSILKPLKGIDPEIYESFRSHCVQDYPAQYEIIFGVSDATDPAVASVEQLQREFSGLTIKLVVCPKILGANVKVSNLEQMLLESRYEHILVNDSDIRVEPDYLRNVVAPLRNSDVGMVTCLYRGVAAPTLASQLEALGISTDFAAGVLAARMLEGGLRFGLGSTLAFRKRDLERIGGFRSIVDYLADDYELGRRIAGLGLKVVLSKVVVETHLAAYDLRGFVAHQMRWARGVRDARLGGYIGLASYFWNILGALGFDLFRCIAMDVGDVGCHFAAARCRCSHGRNHRFAGSTGASRTLAAPIARFDCGRCLDNELLRPYRHMARRPLQIKRRTPDANYVS